MMRYLSITLLTLALLALTSCLAPDGATYTLATVDEDNQLQVQAVSIDAEQEFYRGLFSMCVFVTAAQNNGYGDAAGCAELTALAYAHDEHLNRDMLELWDWDIVKLGD